MFLEEERLLLQPWGRQRFPRQEPESTKYKTEKKKIGLHQNKKT